MQVRLLSWAQKKSLDTQSIGAFFKYSVMKGLQKRKQQFIRFLFGSFSFTAVMFAFQACYGVPENYYVAKGKVVSATTGEPLQGIQVYNNYHGKQAAVLSNSDGEFFVEVDNNATSATLCFRDVDGDENGSYANLDTLVSVVEPEGIIVKLNEKGAEQ